MRTAQVGRNSGDSFIGRTQHRPDVTSIVTDQVKGSMGAIAEVTTDCGHVFCAWHRWQNIIKRIADMSSVRGTVGRTSSSSVAVLAVEFHIPHFGSITG